jgi:hypothetical protein
VRRLFLGLSGSSTSIALFLEFATPLSDFWFACVAPASRLRVACFARLLLLFVLVELLVQPCVQPFLERPVLSPPVVREDVGFSFLLLHGFYQLSR